MESDISIRTQNEKGNEVKYKTKLGLVATSIGHNEDRIVVDAYIGQGKTYTKRELPEISIYQNGKLLFKGDKYELFEKLK